MRIEKLPPERWRDYRAIRLEALATDPDAFGSSVEIALQRPDDWWIGHLETAQREPNKTVLFATEDDRLVGMAGAYPESDPSFVDITSMFVIPSWRGTGIGKALLQAVVDEVQAKEIRLCVNADQAAAVILYRSFGFVTLAETVLPRSDGREYTQLYMALRP